MVWCLVSTGTTYLETYTVEELWSQQKIIFLSQEWWNFCSPRSERKTRDKRTWHWHIAF